MVLSFHYWRERLGVDAAIIGTTLRVNNYSCTVIGVAPPGFQGVEGWFKHYFSSPYVPIAVNGCGTSKPCITIFGITMRRRRRCCSTCTAAGR